MVKIKLATVCLEHGKKDPSTRVEYRLVSTESYCSDPRVTELIRMIARGESDLSSAQAAAWHLANGLSWEELTHKIGAKHLNGQTERYFTAAQIQLAKDLSQAAINRAQKANALSSSGTAVGGTNSAPMQ